MNVEKVLKRGFDSMLMSLVSKILINLTFCLPKWHDQIKIETGKIYEKKNVRLCCGIVFEISFEK